MSTIDYIQSMLENGFLAGFIHPLIGIDHLLVIIGVCILSVRIGDKALLRVPLVFLSMMLIGGLVGITTRAPGLLELSIALSVVIVGLLLTLKRQLPLLLATVCAGVFALVHGHVHATEMPQNLSPLLYFSGFLMGTAALQILGMIIGTRMLNYQFRYFRMVGASTAAAGLLFLISA